jgi:Protein of unknown function (DUF2752)
VVAGRQDRLVAAGLLALALPWLAYTRLYFWLQPRGLTFDGSAFMYLTGKPDPSCGLTRTFAWMWRGDLAHAVSVYPLGPLIVLGTFALVAYSMAVLVGGRSLRFALSSAAQRSIVVGALVALGMNWTSKLIWLGM